MHRFIPQIPFLILSTLLISCAIEAPDAPVMKPCGETPHGSKTCKGNIGFVCDDGTMIKEKICSVTQRCELPLGSDAFLCVEDVHKCNAGEIKCEGDILKTCTDQNKWESRNCTPENKVCSQKSLKCVDCRSGDRKCRDTELLTCGEDGTWEVLQNCTDVPGMNCIKVLQKCAECEPGTILCDNETLKTCNAEGIWVSEDCAASGQVCNKDKKKCTECREGMMKCDEATRTVKYCLSSETWKTKEKCGSEEQCNNEKYECKPWCPEGQFRIAPKSHDHIEVCRNNTWITAEGTECSKKQQPDFTRRIIELDDRPDEFLFCDIKSSFTKWKFGKCAAGSVYDPAIVACVNHEALKVDQCDESTEFCFGNIYFTCINNVLEPASDEVGVQLNPKTGICDMLTKTCPTDGLTRCNTTGGSDTCNNGVWEENPEGSVCAVEKYSFDDFETTNLAEKYSSSASGTPYLIMERCRIYRLDSKNKQITLVQWCDF